LGGEDAILVVDEFPGGYMTERQPDVNSAKKRNNNAHTIICIVEANSIPPRVWLHMVHTLAEVVYYAMIICDASYIQERTYAREMRGNFFKLSHCAFSRRGLTSCRQEPTSPIR